MRIHLPIPGKDNPLMKRFLTALNARAAVLEDGVCRSYKQLFYDRCISAAQRYDRELVFKATEDGHTAEIIGVAPQTGDTQTVLSISRDIQTQKFLVRYLGKAYTFWEFQAGLVNGFVSDETVEDAQTEVRLEHSAAAAGTIGDTAKKAAVFDRILDVERLQDRVGIRYHSAYHPALEHMLSSVHFQAFLSMLRTRSLTAGHAEDHYVTLFFRYCVEPLVCQRTSKGPHALECIPAPDGDGIVLGLLDRKGKNICRLSVVNKDSGYEIRYVWSNSAPAIFSEASLIESLDAHYQAESDVRTEVPEETSPTSATVSDVDLSNASLSVLQSLQSVTEMADLSPAVMVSVHASVVEKTKLQQERVITASDIAQIRADDAFQLLTEFMTHIDRKSFASIQFSRLLVNSLQGMATSVGGKLEAWSCEPNCAMVAVVTSSKYAIDKRTILKVVKREEGDFYVEAAFPYDLRMTPGYDLFLERLAVAHLA
ncbi:MAG: hypothetical protein PHN51_11810 [Candidatus Nanopelagicales bacterium]|nr:hypothetical protein [Candidatus Nanopelagicales bacterium]